MIILFIMYICNIKKQANAGTSGNLSVDWATPVDMPIHYYALATKTDLPEHNKLELSSVSIVQVEQL